jgi:cell division protein ZapA (FtsZ GTPase activity inhibitor)
MDEGQLDRVLADDYVGDVTTLAMDDLRAKRAECQALEVGLSYQRRMAQGRLDLVAAEQRRRAEGGDPPSEDDLVRNLAATLADRQRPPGNGRLPQLMAPEVGDIDTDQLDGIAGPGALARLTEQGDDDLAQLVERLSAYEADVSRRRRALHERIDALQAEITRRYRTGEASVESLLK